MPNELPNLKLKDFSKLENIKKIYEMFGFDDEYPAQEFFRFVLENNRKPIVKCP